AKGDQFPAFLSLEALSGVRGIGVRDLAGGFEQLFKLSGRQARDFFKRALETAKIAVPCSKGNLRNWEVSRSHDLHSALLARNLMIA
ncbi:MAG: hypothetical protein ACRD1R_09915, partial [Acidobacteriota bacterium]